MRRTEAVVDRKWEVQATIEAGDWRPNVEARGSEYEGVFAGSFAAGGVLFLREIAVRARILNFF
jgi:hypothetical protein